jgi:xanthine/CO dehydrogenase XdhC/CoxF family maturation factor
MHELKRLRLALGEACARGEAVMVATVVSVDGSVYRGVGARMAVRADGTAIGAVSGGCLEADVVARFDEVVARGVPEVVTYDTRLSDDVVLGLGLGCQGVIDLLLEPLAGERLADAIAFYDALTARRAPVVVATYLRVPDDGERRVGERVVLDDANEIGRAELELGGAVIAYETVHPPVRLVVCGAGNDAIPLARFAGMLGWSVTVVDHRASFATRERFPDADAIVALNLADDPDALARALTIDSSTAAVCMAHSATHDRAYLRALIAMDAGYVGVLGPRRRTMEMLSDARGEKPVALPPNVHSPIGLDIGAETPEEIALAIVAEITAVQNERSGGKLRDRAGPIHMNRVASKSDVPHSSPHAVSSP